MNRFRLFVSFLFGFIALLNHAGLVNGQQSEDEIIEMRKKMVKTYPFPENSIELEKKFSFPSKELEEKGTYLLGARFLSMDSSGNIYLADNRAHQIIKFDSSGNLLGKFGRQGQGPGEFLNPCLVMATNNFIIVYDAGNYRLQFLDQNGNYVKSFKLYKIYRDMVMSDEGLIFASPVGMEENPLLVDVFTQDGKLLYSFGKPKEFKYDFSDLNAVRLAFNEKGELLMAFNHFPIVRRYSLQGKLLDEYRIDYKIMHFKEKMNLDANRSRGTKVKTGYAVILSAIQPADDGFYILHGALRTEILKFDKNGRMKCAYWNEEYDEKHVCSIDDFLIQEKRIENEFYLLCTSPENKIDVLGLKHK